MSLKPNTERILQTLGHNFQIIKNHVDKDKLKGKFIINITLNTVLVKILNIHKGKDCKPKIGEWVNFWLYQINAHNVKSSL